MPPIPEASRVHVCMAWGAQQCARRPSLDADFRVVWASASARRRQCRHRLAVMGRATSRNLTPRSAGACRRGVLTCLGRIDRSTQRSMPSPHAAPRCRGVFAAASGLDEAKIPALRVQWDHPERCGPSVSAHKTRNEFGSCLANECRIFWFVQVHSIG